MEDDDPDYEDVRWLQCRCVHCGPTDANGQRRCTIHMHSLIAVVFRSRLCEECRSALSAGTTTRKQIVANMRQANRTLEDFFARPAFSPALKGAC